MRGISDDHARDLIARYAAKQSKPDIVRELTDEWFPEQRAFNDDPAQLTAAIDGRRAGKTRSIVRDHLRELMTIPGYQGLYLNSTRGEAEKLAWFGSRGDGFIPLIDKYKLNIQANNSKLILHNPETNGWMHLRGADDEAELRKALGGFFHRVTWDEAQKIPPKLGQSIREVFMPTLLDTGGKFRLTGTPVRQMSGLFYDVTRPEIEKRLPKWKVHHWNLLANPYWGRAEKRADGVYVVARDDYAKVTVSGPHAAGEIDAAIRGARWTYGVLALQELYGGPEVAPIDSPIMQREAFGNWVREDAAYVYAVHKIPTARLFYAPARLRADGFPDIPAALRDLPFDYREAMFSLGVDIGFFPDPFALVLHAWHGHDPALYEVASWRKNYLTSDEQMDAIKAVRASINIGQIVADASNPAKPAVRGWSKEWIERYNQPILEAEKQHKHGAIDTWNNDIIRGRYKMREGGGLYEEMSQLQWATVVSASGKQVEDPTLANDCCDAGLYSHRHSYPYRWQPEERKVLPGTPEALVREERELEEENDEQFDYH